MRIYELYGCPGAGKSTVAARTAERLRAEGIPFADYEAVYFGGNHGKAARLRRAAGALLPPSRWRLNRQIFRTGQALGSVRKYCVSLAVLCARLERAQRKGCRLAVMEEGVVQFLTSLSHDRTFTDLEVLGALIREIQRTGLEIRPVACRLDIEENLRRLRDRGDRKWTRFLRETESASDGNDPLRSLLAVKAENLRIAASFFPLCDALDLAETPEINAEKLANLIRTSL